MQVTFDEGRLEQDPRLADKRHQLPQILAEHRARTAPLRAFYQLRTLKESAPPMQLAHRIRDHLDLSGA
ncbi:hypothetical protein Ahu01nite_044750 [Winogradskya humida]|uniref:Uncharacterized protein n=2 Tax=Winogradskya humida TaxID=113566 RepID=A0ABQ3ZS24_9ACTN|nr:hypothetical protein Ahu01nite_044750 [Actinoplanes humidus]